jgi:hypothetical protein
VESAEVGLYIFCGLMVFASPFIVWSGIRRRRATLARLEAEGHTTLATHEGTLAIVVGGLIIAAFLGVLAGKDLLLYAFAWSVIAVILAGPLILIIGLIKRSTSRKQDLVDNPPPLPVAGLGDRVPNPRGRATKGNTIIVIGALLTVLCVLLLFVAHALSGIASP